MIENAKQLSSIVVENTDSEGTDKLNQDIQHLENEWEDINKFIDENEELLSKCVTAWDDFTTVLKALTNWQNSTMKKVCIYDGNLKIRCQIYLCF